MSSILAITDIPRFKSIFIQLNSEEHSIRIAGEIHRGVEEIERAKPDLIVFQNHLSGLSADIVLKHLKGKVGRRRCRYILISPPEVLSPEFTEQLSGVIDPTLPDEQIKQKLIQLLANQTLAAPQALQEPFIQHQQEKLSDAINPIQSPPAPDNIQKPAQEPSYDDLPLLTYSLPRRPNASVISAFSQHLDSTVDDLPSTTSQTDAGITSGKPWLHDEMLITDLEELKPKRSLMLWLSASVIAIVVAVTYIQNKPSNTRVSVEPQKAVSGLPVTQAQIQAAKSSQTKGPARLASLPSFIPKEALDPNYGIQNRGWERYLTKNSEFRIFREIDGTIKALQLIDRSGTGIPDAQYKTLLKDLTGIINMRPTSSEIKDNFEIRRGDLAGIQLVQYREAKGGKMRGFVLTWP